jgi:hypothetical protein
MPRMPTNNLKCRYFHPRYEYSHQKDRLWRKTRSRSGGFGCVGTDPNRNFGYNWGGQGASGNPCDETYYGKKAFSEPETAAMRDFIMDSRRKNLWKARIIF